MGYKACRGPWVASDRLNGISMPSRVYSMVHQGITERGLSSFIASVPLFTNLLLLFELSLLFRLAFEEFHAHQGTTQPGGVRTFPLLAATGAMLYLLDPARLVPLSMGLLGLVAWRLCETRLDVGAVSIMPPERISLSRVWSSG